VICLFPAGKLQDITSDYAIATSFHILSISLLIILPFDAAGSINK
jgi:hypothetical protein